VFLLSPVCVTKGRMMLHKGVAADFPLRRRSFRCSKKCKFQSQDEFLQRGGQDPRRPQQQEAWISEINSVRLQSQTNSCKPKETLCPSVRNIERYRRTLTWIDFLEKTILEKVIESSQLLQIERKVQSRLTVLMEGQDFSVTGACTCS
jgi:hypothetical protein